MRKSKRFILFFLMLILLSGCSTQNQRPDFGTEVINDNVQLPEIAYKEDILACYNADGKTVYTLGTRHQKHFYPQCEYSLQDIQSVIENISPDYVFIECREEIFDMYGALDGPQEFQFIYAYCIDHDIPVEMIDWYVIDESTIEKMNSTFDERDNQMFYNIYDKMQKIEKGETVLICYGDAHFFYQQPRMERAGWEQVELEDAKALFASEEKTFQYPQSMLKIVENCIGYYESSFMEEIRKTVTDENALLIYEQIAARGVNVYKEYKQLVEQQKLYY